MVYVVTEDDVREFMKVMTRMVGMLYEGVEGGKVWRSHSVMRGESVRERERVIYAP